MEHQTDVALAISKHVLLTEAKNSNAVLSPVSIHVVLSLIAAGAKGPTQDQLLSFLKAKSIDHLNSLSAELLSVLASCSGAGSHGGPTLSFANGVWVDKSLSLRQTFKQVAGSVYKASSHEVDFQYRAAEVITEVNEWAERSTNGLIKNVLPPDAIDSKTRLVLGNALYFKGAWNQKFDGSATKDHDFHLLNGGSVRVPFMSSKKDQFISRCDGFKVLSLPYKQGRSSGLFSMHILLPDSIHGLPALVERAGSEPRFLSRHLPRKEVEVGELRIPKFEVSFAFEASDTLKGLGLVLPFSGAEAELSEMVESPAAVVGSKLSVSSIFHRSFIEVNEEGTEAAAASFADAFLVCYVEPVKFVADHPFMFVVQEHLTGTVLFSGQIHDPLQ